MGRVTELRVRADWQFIRFVYLPTLGLGLLPFQPCAICVFCSWWGHHLEEWARRKPLFQITDSGLRYEDGGKSIEYAWSDIQGIALLRKNDIPFWRTDGSTELGEPRFWLSITVRERGKKAGQEAMRTICVWPRQVVGGLLSLMRFGKTLQQRLINVSAQGEIPSLLPKKERSL